MWIDGDNSINTVFKRNTGSDNYGCFAHRRLAALRAGIGRATGDAMSCHRLSRIKEG